LAHDIRDEDLSTRSLTGNPGGGNDAGAEEIAVLSNRFPALTPTRIRTGRPASSPCSREPRPAIARCKAIAHASARCADGKLAMNPSPMLLISCPP
jgi:hypothetical protein